MTVIQRLLAGPLCGVFPRLLEARASTGRLVLMVPWRGDRSTALAFASEVAAHPSAHTVSLVYDAYVFAFDDTRRRVESRIEFQKPLRDLLDEQAQRQARRDEATARRVQWRGRAPRTRPAVVACAHG